VTTGPTLLRAYVVRLRKQRTHTVELRIQADAMLGRHRELVGELKAMLLTDPLNECRSTSGITRS